MSKASDMVRENFKRGDDIRDAGLVTPDDVLRYDDIIYGEDPLWQSLDIYKPKQIEKEGEKIPVIVSVHGGGWVYGDKERYQYYCMSLAQRGFAVVNYSYRLAPENKFPSSLEDTNKVFLWVLSHGESYGLDTDHIFAVGDSAGAHILGLYSAICTNPSYARKYQFQVPDRFAPKAVALNCGAYVIDFEGNNTDELTKELIADLLPGRGTEEELYAINVKEHITPAFPPTFLMTAAGDFLKNQAVVLAEKLIECEVPFLCRFYGDEKNQLGHVFHCNMKLKEAAVCNNDECSFFKTFLDN